MKNNLKNIAILAFVSLVAFSFTTIETKNVNIKKSKITWQGHKVTGQHEGMINLQSGFLTFNGETLTGGEFVIDMNTIICTDLEGDYKGKLEGHLKSDDFFGVTEHPTAKLVLKKVKAQGNNIYKVAGNLTIKGKTNPISFDLTINGNKATTALKVDRAKYDVKYGSTSFFEGLKDKAIYDEFDLNVSLEF